MKRLAALAVWLALLAPAHAQSGLRNTPLGFCAISSLGSAVAITSSNCVFASFTGVLSATGQLTVSAVTGTLIPGQPLVGAGVPAYTLIAGQSSGTPGGAGQYTVTSSPLTAIGSEAMTTAGAPIDAQYAVLCASTQAINYRDDGTAPTATAGSGGQFIPSGQCIGYNGTFANLQFIQQASSPVLGISFYK